MTYLHSLENSDKSDFDGWVGIHRIQVQTLAKQRGHFCHFLLGTPAKELHHPGLLATDEPFTEQGLKLVHS